MSLWTWIAGKVIKSKIDLQEDSQMDSTKPWYQSKGVWVGVVGILVVAYNQALPTFHLPAIPEWILGILSAAGLYSRVTAETKIG